MRPIWSALVSEVQTQGLADTCELIVSVCQGRCEHGPNINIYPNLKKYAYLTPDKARRIVKEHLLAGRPVAEYLYRSDE